MCDGVTGIFHTQLLPRLLDHLSSPPRQVKEARFYSGTEQDIKLERQLPLNMLSAMLMIIQWTTQLQQ